MREALNNNPRVQLAVFGVGIVVLGLVFLTMMGGGSSSTKPPPPAAAAAPSSAASTTPSAATTSTPAPTTSSAPAPASTPAPAPAADASTGSSSGLLPGPGLPKNVLVAYARNEAIALLVIDPKSFSDRQLKAYTKSLHSEDGVAVFIVNAKHIANYARITQGVAVDRTPALVVVRPRTRTEGVPTAIVEEGFRGADSVRTALHDALYKGPTEPSYPQ